MPTSRAIHQRAGIIKVTTHNKKTTTAVNCEHHFGSITLVKVSGSPPLDLNQSTHCSRMKNSLYFMKRRKQISSRWEHSKTENVLKKPNGLIQIIQKDKLSMAFFYKFDLKKKCIKWYFLNKCKVEIFWYLKQGLTMSTMLLLLLQAKLTGNTMTFDTHFDLCHDIWTIEGSE